MKAKRSGNREERGRPGSRDAALAWTSLSYTWFGQLWKLQPMELFTVCSDQEKRFDAINGKDFLESLDRMRLFEGPVFSEEPESRARKAYEFGLLITRPQGSKAEWRYTELVKKLTKLQESELRWLLIARWLEGEGVCKAEEFLPKEILKRLLKRAKSGRLKVSPRDLQLARWVRIWLPYFERLLDDRDRLLKKCRGIRLAMNELSGRGYVEGAIDSTVGKREPVQAVITWLTSRGEAGMGTTNERTLENAYSRVEAAKRKADAKFEQWLLRQQHRTRQLRHVEPWEYHNILQLIS
jgi:hypothetical protein